MKMGQEALGRRAMISEASVAAGLLVGAPLSASAKGGKSSGSWAKHDGEFTEAELDGFTETKSVIRIEKSSVKSIFYYRGGSAII